MLSQKARYALRALVELARAVDSGRLQRAESGLYTQCQGFRGPGLGSGWWVERRVLVVWSGSGGTPPRSRLRQRQGWSAVARPGAGRA